MTISRIVNSTVWNADADELTEHYQTTLTSAKVEPLGSCKTISVEDRHYSTDAFDIWSGGCRSGMQVCFIEPPDCYVIYLPKRGRIDIEIGQNHHALNADQGFIGDFSTFERIQFHEDRCHTGIAISKKTFIHQMSQIIDLPVTRTIEFLPVLDKNSLALARLSGISELLWSSLNDETDTGSAVLFSQSLFKAIVALTIETIPHNYTAVLQARTPVAIPRQIKRAIDFMVSNAHRQLTIVEIADQSGVSIRSLQAGFQQFKGTTPLHFLRQVRLDGVRKALMKDIDHNSIVQIARMWGFTHMGRFAGQYSDAFGELPSQTVRSPDSRTKLPAIKKKAE